jgi:hypothetical protein
MIWRQISGGTTTRGGRSHSGTVRRVTVLTGLVLIAAVAAPSAQRRRAGNAGEGLPVGTAQILRQPETYFGKRVTVSAGVDEILSGTAFVADQRKATSATTVVPAGAPLLVIAPYLKTSLDPKGYLVVRGEVVKFDGPAALASVEPGYKLDIPPDVVAKYQGKPVLVALSIRDGKFKELGAKLLPPPSAEEVSMTTVMKTISGSFGQLEGAIDVKQADVVTAQAAKLQPAFAEAAQIFGTAQRMPAADLARAASGHAASLEKAATAADWVAAGDAFRALRQQCQSCHKTQRQTQEDGTFRFAPAEAR